MPGPRPLQGAGARTVRSRRIRQRPRNRRRHRAGGARGQGLARQGQLPGNRDRSDRGIACFARADAAKRPRSIFKNEGLPDVRSRQHRCPSIRPVTDWVHDFDHTDPRWTENPFPIWDEMRAQRPIAHTDRFLGCYLPTTYEAVRAVAHDTEHFSSRRVIVRESGRNHADRGAADHLRPARAQAGQAVAAAALHARRHEEAGAAGARDLQRADRRVHRARQLRCGGALHQGYPGARPSPTCSASRKRTAISSSNGST